MAALYSPQPHLRERACDPAKTCLLLVDVQNFNCERKGALYAHLSEQQLDGADLEYWWRRVVELRRRPCPCPRFVSHANSEKHHAAVPSGKGQ